MNCRKIERLIYLYDESAESERSFVDEHLASCSSCRELWSRVSSIRNAVAGGVDYQLAHQETFTRRIMDRISREQEEAPSFLDHLRVSWIRYSLSVVSCFLVAAFVHEQVAVSVPAGPVQQEVQALNTTAALQRLTGARPRTGLFQNCIAVCTSAGTDARLCSDCIEKLQSPSGKQ